MEIIDLYNKEKQKLNKTFKRGKDKLNKDEYYLLEQIWIINKNKEILLTQRNKNKSYGGLWEPTTGHVKTKEKDIEGALRELKEELNITVKKQELTYIKHIIIDSKIIDIWLLNKDIKLEQITKKQDEVTNIKYVSIQKFKEMQNNNELTPNLEYFIDIYKKI